MCTRYPQTIVRLSHRRSIVHNCNAMAFWRHLEQKQKARAKSPTEFKNNQSQNYASLVQHVEEAKFNQM
jgi:hypothetical protein